MDQLMLFLLTTEELIFRRLLFKRTYLENQAILQRNLVKRYWLDRKSKHAEKPFIEIIASGGKITSYFMELASPHTEEAIKFVDKISDRRLQLMPRRFYQSCHLTATYGLFVFMGIVSVYVSVW
ncbi:uncharacterized protein LOC141843796 [Curcuma longa]|uniref:uncharacterized protein LOC141843796 n=1 Tax=Curcuma longa TaxID=136217 RepID=UPI003D9DCBDF